MERFAKIINSFLMLTIFAKSSILDVSTGAWIRLCSLFSNIFKAICNSLKNARRSLKAFLMFFFKMLQTEVNLSNLNVFTAIRLGMASETVLGKSLRQIYKNRGFLRPIFSRIGKVLVGKNPYSIIFCTMNVPFLYP